MMSGNLGGAGSSLASLFSGLFGNSGAPYGDAMKQFQKFFGQAQGFQNPFYNAGVNAIGGYQDWLSKMKDPSAFLNNLMGNYQQSGYNKFLQDQSQRAGINAASAGGTIGSTPFMQQQQQNSANIAQQGMNDWLGQALGINSQYGGGLNTLMQGGQNASNIMSQLAMMMGGRMGEGAFGQRFGQNYDRNNIFSGLLSLFL